MVMPTTNLGISPEGACAQSAEIEKKATKEEITLIIIKSYR